MRLPDVCKSAVRETLHCVVGCVGCVDVCLAERYRQSYDLQI